MVDRDFARGDRLTGSDTSELIDIYHSLDSFVSDRLPSPKKAKSKKSRKPAQSRAGGEVEIVGSSPLAVKMREQIKLYAEDDSPVLISGETGVGKELVARHIHAFSKRNAEPFNPLNAGAIPETLAAGELFGHKKGAFTGAVSDRIGALAAADRGTLFIDEIGEMPLPIQSHFLRVLEDGKVTMLGGSTSKKVDFRLVAATNVDLLQATNSGKFRLDLYYRVNVLFIDVPPLRARGDDVIEIAEALIASHSNEAYRSRKISPRAADCLRKHRFPGNVRELRNVLARALVHARDGAILPEHLLFDPCSAAQPHKMKSLNIAKAKSLVQRFLILKALQETDGNVSKAAELTGRSRSTVHTLTKEFDGDDFANEYKTACSEVKALFDTV